MTTRAIVLDANILIRAVLGKRVRELLVGNAERVQFFSPDVAYADARKYLPALLEKRGVKSESAIAVLNALQNIDRNGTDIPIGHPLFLGCLYQTGPFAQMVRATGMWSRGLGFDSLQRQGFRTVSFTQ
jgi:hypothetical protein